MTQSSQPSCSYNSLSRCHGDKPWPKQLTFQQTALMQTHPVCIYWNWSTHRHKTYMLNYTPSTSSRECTSTLMHGHPRTHCASLSWCSSSATLNQSLKTCSSEAQSASGWGRFLLRTVNAAQRSVTKTIPLNTENNWVLPTHRAAHALLAAHWNGSLCLHSHTKKA